MIKMFVLSRSLSRVQNLGLGLYKCPCQLVTAIYFSSASEAMPIRKSGRRISQSKTSISDVFLGNKVKHKLKDWNELSGDPDLFGTLSVSNNTVNEDKGLDQGDLIEKEHLENPPDYSQKLSTKQYSDIIKYHLRNKNLKEAINVLQERMLKQDKVKPENYIYNLLIGACGRTGQAKQAFHLYNQMKKRNLNVTGGTYTALFNACATSFYPKDGLKRANNLRQIMIEKNYQPNSTNYHAMIKAYGRCGDLGTAFSLVDEMIERKLGLTSDTINFLLHACVTDQEAGFRHALLVWRKMRDHNVKPSIFTYNLILRACRDCGLGNTQEAHDLLNRIATNSQQLLMSKCKIKATEHQETVNLVHSFQKTQLEAEPIGKPAIHDCGPQDFEKSVNRLIEDEIVASPVKLTSDIVDANWPNLLAAQPRLGSVVSVSQITSAQDRLLLLGGCTQFLEQMVLDNAPPNVKTFTQLLDLIPPTRAAEKDLMRSMAQIGISKDIDFYNVLIKKRSMQSDYKGARDVLSLISSARLTPDIITYGVLALSCKTEPQAMQLLTEMEQAGFRVNAEVLGALLKQACLNWNFRYVLKMMEAAKQEEIEINAPFYQHLDSFYRKGRQMIFDKECGRPVPKFVDSDYFRSSFKIFSARYKNWLRETQKEPPDMMPMAVVAP